MRRLPARVAETTSLLIAVWLAPGAPAAAQRTFPQVGLDTEIESDSLTGFWVGVVAVGSPYVAGGAFQGLGAGAGVAALVTADLGRALAVDLRGAMTSVAETVIDGRAELVDVGIQLRWRVEAIPGDVRFGPLLGLSWRQFADRPGYDRGFHGGAAVSMRWPIADGWALITQGEGLWAGFDAPSMPGAPIGPSEREFGRRATLQLGVARRLGR